MKSWQLDVPLV